MLSTVLAFYKVKRCQRLILSRSEEEDFERPPAEKHPQSSAGLVSACQMSVSARGDHFRKVSCASYASGHQFSFEREMV